MEKDCGIYKITNTINGKVYIGQSTDLGGRFAEHKKCAKVNSTKEKYNYPLYRAMRKYGIDNFQFIVLEYCEDVRLDEREIYYIAHYQANNKDFGYNQTAGGHSGSHKEKLTQNDVQNIIVRLKTTLDSTKIIAADYNVGFTTIRNINVGESYHQKNETYPIRPNVGSLQMREDGGYQKRKKKQYFCPVCGAVVTKQGCKCKKCSTANTRKICTNIDCSGINTQKHLLALAQSVKQNGFEATGKQNGVTGKAIQQIFRRQGLPHTKKELIAWYDNEMGIITEERIPKKAKEEIVRPVKQIDKETGACLNIFPSQADALRLFGAKRQNSHISEVCRGIRKSAYGYYWQYADTENT